MYDKVPISCNSPQVTYNVRKYLTHYTMSHIHLTTSVFRVMPMVHVIFWLPFLFVVFLLEQSNAVSDQCGELQSEISCIRKLNHRNKLLLDQCYVSGYYIVNVSSLECSYMQPTNHSKMRQSTVVPTTSFNIKRLTFAHVPCMQLV